MAIQGIKLIRHNTARVNNPDDPSLPWRLDARFRLAGTFMEFAAISIFGPYEIVCVRGETKEKLEEFVKANSLDTHPRLSKLEITQPESVATP